MQPLPSDDYAPPSQDQELTIRVPFIHETSISTNPPKIGNCYAYWYNSEGDPRILIGPDYKFFTGLNIFIYFFSFIVLIAAGIKGRILSLVGGIILLIIQSGVYFWTAFKNPGLPSRAASRIKYQLHQGD